MARSRPPLQINFINPNTPEETEQMIRKVFAPAIARMLYEVCSTSIDEGDDEDTTIAKMRALYPPNKEEDKAHD